MRYLLLWAGAVIWAQAEWCGFESYGSLLRAEDPELDLRQALLESAAHMAIQARQTQAELECTQSSYVIPVVFHIIYSNASDSISYDRVWNQMLRVFEDFRRVPESAGYAGVGVDTKIEFSLATKDPNGNPTTGVVYWRYDQPPLNWSSRDFCRETQDLPMKQATGWDRTKYLNVWIVPRLCVDPNGGTNCTSCNSVAGYAFFPTANADRFGTVIGSDFFWGGSFSRGPRTIVHELGHNLNLFHTFQGECGTTNCTTSGDGICDTPPTAQNNFSVRRQNTCTNDFPDRPDNPRNYMDYVNDADMSYFSAGQVTRSTAAMNSSFSRLFSLSRSNNQQPTGTGPYGHVKAYFAAVLRQGCVGVPIDFYSYSMGMPHLYQWDFGGGVPDDPTASCPAVTFSQAGTYDVQLVVENLSGRRDTLRKANYITILDTLYALPYKEGFEATTFPPEHTLVVNPDGRSTWQRFRSTSPPRGAYGLSPASMRVHYFNYSYYRERDSWVSPPIDLGPYTDPDVEVRLRFSWAYACLAYENPSATPASYLLDYTDSLRVYVSADCGRTWNLVWEKGGRDLATHPDGCIEVSGAITVSAAFLPTATMWATDSLSLSAYKGLSPVRVRFEGVSGWGNTLYLDDIEIDTVRNIASTASGRVGGLEGYVSEGYLHIKSAQALPGLSYWMYDLQGRLVGQKQVGPIPAGWSRWALPGELAAGVYGIRVESAVGGFSVRYWHQP